MRRNVPKRRRSLKIILVEIDTTYFWKPDCCTKIFRHVMMSELLPNGHHFGLRFTPGFTTTYICTVRKLLAFIFKALPKFDYILAFFPTSSHISKYIGIYIFQKLLIKSLRLNQNFAWFCNKLISFPSAKLLLKVRNKKKVIYLRTFLTRYMQRVLVQGIS